MSDFVGEQDGFESRKGIQPNRKYNLPLITSWEGSIHFVFGRSLVRVITSVIHDNRNRSAYYRVSDRVPFLGNLDCWSVCYFAKLSFVVRSHLSPILSQEIHVFSVAVLNLVLRTQAFPTTHTHIRHGVRS